MKALDGYTLIVLLLLLGNTMTESSSGWLMPKIYKYRLILAVLFSLPVLKTKEPHER